MRPRMVVIAGPPGSGKSTAFPVNSFGIDSFNADDRAAEVNGGSYQGISIELRAVVNREFERFVSTHIQQRRSFAIETTLRTGVTFEQAAQARVAGFEVHMRYIILREFNENLKRVIARARSGGHSAPPDQLRSIHEASLRNLPRAIREMDSVRVYDNSSPGGPPTLVLQSIRGHIEKVSSRIPELVRKVLRL